MTDDSTPQDKGPPIPPIFFRALREKTSWSQEEAARRAELSLSGYQKYEHDDAFKGGVRSSRAIRRTWDVLTRAAGLSAGWVPGPELVGQAEAKQAAERLRRGGAAAKDPDPDA